LENESRKWVPSFVSNDQVTSCPERNEHNRSEVVHHLTGKLFPQGLTQRKVSIESLFIHLSQHITLLLIGAIWFRYTQLNFVKCRCSISALPATEHIPLSASFKMCLQLKQNGTEICYQMPCMCA